MGLDMYLSARKTLSAWSGDDRSKLKDVMTALDLDMEDLTEFGMVGVDIPIAEWRKVNQIHAWFVKNIQGREDDCKTYYVSRDYLVELVYACDQVVAAKGNEEVARELLPTAPGSFYGSYDYGDWYYETTAEVRDQIHKILLNEKFNDCDFYYSSSW